VRRCTDTAPPNYQLQVEGNIPKITNMLELHSFDVAEADFRPYEYFELTVIMKLESGINTDTEVYIRIIRAVRPLLTSSYM
jgi:hypothetical protein